MRVSRRSAVIALVVVLAALLATSGPLRADGDPPGQIEPLPPVRLDGTWLMATVSVVLAVLLEYVPGFSKAWGSYAYKRETLALVGLVLAWGMVGAHYINAIDLGIGAFGWPVVGAVIQAWLAYAGAGQLAWTGMRAVNAVPRLS